jgi:hypothetical protein
MKLKIINLVRDIKDIFKVTENILIFIICGLAGIIIAAVLTKVL